MQNSFRLSPLSLAVAALAPWVGFTRHMSDDATAADTAAQVQASNDATDNANAAASDEAPASVAVDVPAQHVSLIQRAVALLEKGEQFVIDNVEAGITTLESFFTEKKD